MTHWQNRLSDKIEWVDPNELTPHPLNARRHPQHQQDALQGSLDTLGWVSVCIVSRFSNRILDGHLRQDMALATGDNVPVLYVDLKSEAEEQQFLLTFDWITQMAEYDREELDLLLQGVRADDERLQVMLADMAEEHELYFGNEPLAPPEDMGAQIDRAEELNQVWQVQHGDLWIIPSITGEGEHRLLCGDSTNTTHVEQLMGGDRAQICFTSPPYNIAAASPSKVKYQAYADDLAQGDYLTFLRTFTTLALKHADYCFVNIQSLAGNKVALIDYLYQMRDHYADTIIWDKQVAEPAIGTRVLNSRFEYIHIFSQQATRAIGCQPFRGTIDNVLTLNSRQDKQFSDVHKATYPVAFATWGVGHFTTPDAVVYDPFGGSGTTMVACEQLQRQCRMMELEPKYCAVILERMKGAGCEPCRA